MPGFSRAPGWKKAWAEQGMANRIIPLKKNICFIAANDMELRKKIFSNLANLSWVHFDRLKYFSGFFPFGAASLAFLTAGATTDVLGRQLRRARP